MRVSIFDGDKRAFFLLSTSEYTIRTPSFRKVRLVHLEHVMFLHQNILISSSALFFIDVKTNIGYGVSYKKKDLIWRLHN